MDVLFSLHKACSAIQDTVYSPSICLSQQKLLRNIGLKSLADMSHKRALDLGGAAGSFPPGKGSRLMLIILASLTLLIFLERL